jgi:hypothetical protein
MAMTTPTSDQAYLAHLEGLGHQRLAAPVIAGFNAWYQTVLPTDRNAAILDFGCGLGDRIMMTASRGAG